MEITKLSNQQLILATKNAVRMEKDQTHKVILHLQEIDRRRIYWVFTAPPFMNIVAKNWDTLAARPNIVWPPLNLCADP